MQPLKAKTRCRSGDASYDPIGGSGVGHPGRACCADSGRRRVYRGPWHRRRFGRCAHARSVPDHSPRESCRLRVAHMDWAPCVAIEVAAITDRGRHCSGASLLGGWAARTPDAVALVAPGYRPLTYGRLAAQMSRARSSSCGGSEDSRNSLAHQRLDLLAMSAEAQKDTLVDEHGGHGQAAGEAEHLLAGLGVAPDISHLHRRAARLKECQRGLAVGDAFHGKEQYLLHDPPTIPFRVGIGLLLASEMTARV